MKRTTRKAEAWARAVILIVLMLNVQFRQFGCTGFDPSQFGVAPGWTRVELTPDHPLTRALKGSAFDGAAAVELNATSREFRVVFPDAERWISGTFDYANGAAFVTSVSFELGSKASDAASKTAARLAGRDASGAPAQSATLTLDAAKRITSIATGDGQRWDRPAEWSKAPTDPKLSDVDAYVAANAQLVETARAMDAAGGRAGTAGTGSTPPPANGASGAGTAVSSSGGKIGQTALLGAVPWIPILGGIVFIVGYSATIAAALLLVFTLVSAVQSGLPRPPATKTLKIARVLDADSPIAATASVPGAETLAVLASKDLDGNAVRVTGASFLAADGSAVTILLGSDGLPSEMVTSDGWIIEFAHYDGDKVDLRITDPAGSTTTSSGVTLDNQTLSELRQLAVQGLTGAHGKSAASMKLMGQAQTNNTPLTLSTMFRIGGLVVGAFGCGIAIAGLVPTFGASVSLLVSCGSLALSVHSFLTGDEATRDASTGVKIATCIGRKDCGGLVLDAGARVSDALERRQALRGSTLLEEGSFVSSLSPLKVDTYGLDVRQGQIWIISVTPFSDSVAPDICAFTEDVNDGSTHDIGCADNSQGRTANLMITVARSEPVFVYVLNPSETEQLDYEIVVQVIPTQPVSLLNGRYAVTEWNGTPLPDLRLEFLFADGALVSAYESVRDDKTGERFEVWYDLKEGTRGRLPSGGCLWRYEGESIGARLDLSLHVEFGMNISYGYDGDCDSSGSLWEYRFSGQVEDLGARFSGRMHSRIYRDLVVVDEFEQELMLLRQ